MSCSAILSLESMSAAPPSRPPSSILTDSNTAAASGQHPDTSARTPSSQQRLRPSSNCGRSVPEAARLRAVGLVVPGVVDAQQGIAVYAANIGWQQLPLRQIVAEAVGLPVILDHDVRAAGLAELELGAGRGLQEVLFVALGTGIAAAVITRGQVSAGATGRAGELGHLPVFPEGEWCACGQRGCTETYASASALSRRYSAASGISDVPAKDVISRATAGDPWPMESSRTRSLPWAGLW